MKCKNYWESYKKNPKTGAITIKLYEVEYDTDVLEELMAKLDKECYVRRFVLRTITVDNTDKDAKEWDFVYKTLEEKKNVGELESFVITYYKPIYSTNGKSTDDQTFYQNLKAKPCKYKISYKGVAKKSVALVEDIRRMLSKTSDCINDRAHFMQFMERLTKFKKSYDFVSFKTRAKWEKEHADCEAGQGYSDYMDYLTSLADIELNANYDFKRLLELYREVANSLRYNLLQTTTIHNPDELLLANKGMRGIPCHPHF